MKSLLTYWHKNLSRSNRREVIAEEKLAKISEVEDWTEERAQLRVKEKIMKVIWRYRRWDESRI